MIDALNLYELEKLAKEKLPQSAHGVIDRIGPTLGGIRLQGGGSWLIAGLGMMVVGIGFKLAVVPFHLWTPDVYQGAPAPVTAFVATVSKGGVVAVLLRLFPPGDIKTDSSLFFVFTAIAIAIATMLAGNLLALLQNNVKRILAYSSIAHIGYILVAFLASGSQAVTAVTFYLMAYFVSTIGAFGVITVLSGPENERESLDDYRGLFWRCPWLAGAFTAMVLSLAGLPLTAGFVAKFYLAMAGVGAALWTLVVILVLSSTIGLYYYLRILVTLYVKQPEPRASSRPEPAFSVSGGLTVAVLTFLLIWLGVMPAPMIALIQTMIR